MNATNENHKETEAHVIRLSGQIERIQQTVEKDDEDASAKGASEQICENGVCRVAWKPQRPAA